jgi:hypothetical protein
MGVLESGLVQFWNVPFTATFTILIDPV